MPDPNPALFAGTAEYYARYRGDYPDPVYAHLHRAFVSGQDLRDATVLDLGTGTGQIALRLAPDFAQVIGIDTSSEMIEVARRTAGERGLQNVEFRVLAAESLTELDGTDAGGPYHLVTVGSALHWMDPALVLDLAYRRTRPGGGFFITALPGFITPDNVLPGDRLAEVIVAVIRKHLGERRRAGTGFFGTHPRPWREFLDESSYVDIESGYEPFTITVDADHILGLLYSTSFANRRLLGDRVEAFEHDLREALYRLDPSGWYARTYQAEWILAHRRP